MNKILLINMLMFSLFAKAQTTPQDPKTPIYDIEISSLSGESIDLSTYKGKKILFVNVASKCGFTNQYEELQELHEKHGDKLVIIGLPCNQFGKQEPGNAKEIQSFCKLNYGVDFLMTEKIKVKGAAQHPLYSWLTTKEKNGNRDSSVKWNFQKYLVDEQGRLVCHFLSITTPMSTKIIKLL